MTHSFPTRRSSVLARGLEPAPPLRGDHRCDVCVIGGGYTGIATALHLAERGYKAIVLEARRVGWGASGRNGGQLSGGQRLDPDRSEEHTSELQSLMRLSYAVFCLKKKKKQT